MNVSGVSREQLVKHLAPKRLKQRKALEGKPEPIPEPVAEPVAEPVPSPSSRSCASDTRGPARLKSLAR